MINNADDKSPFFRQTYFTTTAFETNKCPPCIITIRE